MKRILTIGLIALVALTSHAWTPMLLESPSIMALAQSVGFGWAVLAGIAFSIAASLGLVALLALNPSRSGRTEPEGGL